MLNLDKYRDDHAELLALAAEIRHMLYVREVKKKPALAYELVSELTRRTLAHLLLEDQCLYPELLMSEHDETRTLAQQNLVGMGNVAGKLRRYIGRWPSADEIVLHPKRFCRDTAELLESLEQRIQREEQYLYPASESHG